MGEKGLGTDPGVVGTGAPDAGRIGGADLNADGAADRATHEDTWPPPAGVGKVSSDSGGLASKSASVTVMGSPGGSPADRRIGSPMGGAADRGTETPEPGIVQYNESALE